MSKRIRITGGAGFIGSHLADELLQCGYEVRVVDCLVPQVHGDTSDRPPDLPLDSHHKVANSILELTGGSLCDCVIEACGLQASLDLVSQPPSHRRPTRDRGISPRRPPPGEHAWNAIAVINAHERNTERYVDGIRQAIAATTSGALDHTALYTHRLTLEHLDQAFQLLKERPPGFLKGLIIMKSS